MSEIKSNEKKGEGKGMSPKLATAESSGYMKRLFAFLIISMGCIIAAGACAIIDFSIADEFTWSPYPILSIALAWLICTPLLIKSNSFAKWALPPTLLVLPYLFLLEKMTPFTGWFVNFALPIAALNIIALWLCFFVAKRLLPNGWHFAAALIFINGAVFSPITALLLINLTGMGSLFSDSVSTIVGLAIFISMLSCLVVAGMLAIIGYTKGSSSICC